jgi:hypothetical protein
MTIKHREDINSVELYVLKRLIEEIKNKDLGKYNIFIFDHFHLYPYSEIKLVKVLHSLPGSNTFIFIRTIPAKSPIPNATDYFQKLGAEIHDSNQHMDALIIKLIKEKYWRLHLPTDKKFVAKLRELTKDDLIYLDYLVRNLDPEMSIKTQQLSTSMIYDSFHGKFESLSEFEKRTIFLVAFFSRYEIEPSDHYIRSHPLIIQDLNAIIPLYFTNYQDSQEGFDKFIEDLDYLTLKHYIYQSDPQWYPASTYQE